jgi:hypothetical protein
MAITTVAYSENLVKAFKQGHTNFREIDLSKANLVEFFLPFVVLERACLYQTDCRHAVLPGAELKGAYLAEALFDHANLLSADLSWTNLYQARLDHALLSSARLTGANLMGASLIGTRLANASLCHANLRNAYLVGASLRGADLSKANLFGARIDPNTLSGAILDDTVMPDGTHCTRPQPQPCKQPAHGTHHHHLKKTTSVSSPSHKKQTRTAIPLQGAYQKKTQATSKSPHQPPSKLIGFRVDETRSDLILEILEYSKQYNDSSFICVNHLL